jgi:hypothetical protein
VLPKGGGNWRQAIEKLLKRVKGNKIQMGCSLYSEMSIHVGTYMAGEQTAQFYTRKADADSDWIPGDRGYIDNTTITDAENPTITAEYLIYVGDGKFYGHFSGAGKDKPQDFDFWNSTVDGWTKDVENDIRVDPARDATGAGLWTPLGVR